MASFISCSSVRHSFISIFWISYHLMLLLIIPDQSLFSEIVSQTEFAMHRHGNASFVDVIQDSGVGSDDFKLLAMNEEIGTCQVKTK